MMGRQAEPEQLFYDVRLDDHVPADHLLRTSLPGKMHRKAVVTAETRGYRPA